MNSVYSSGAVVAATPRRWSSVAASAVLHVALVLLIAYAGRAAGVLPEKTVPSLTFVRLEQPVRVVQPETPRLVRPRVPRPPVVKEAVKREPAIPVPEIEPPPVPERVVARVEPPRPAPEPRPSSPVAPNRPTPTPPVVQVGGFAASAPAAQAAQPSRPVQQAGFDASEARASGPAVASAVVGAFEQSAAGGPRSGNGRAVGVADAGFGAGVAAAPAGGGGGGRGVATGGLDAGTGSSGSVAKAPQAVRATDFDARPVSPSAPKPSLAARVEVPVEILSKPVPAYTDEARAMKIEGEVAVEVEFAATGEIRVLKVLRGLGYGLDERAVRAVQGMRFRPAQRHGQPVDVRTTVNIVFRLA